MKVLRKMAGWLYAILDKRRPMLNRVVKKDLECLHPGEDLDIVCREYCVGKLVKSVGIALAGTVLALLLALHASGERVIEGNTLLREDVLGEATTVEIETVLEGEKERFEILVQPVWMDAQEAQRCYLDFCKELPQLIVGGNDSLQQITQDLLLLDSYEGYPFRVEWRSSEPDYINSSGEVCAGDETKKVQLHALISYGEQEWKKLLAVQVAAEVLSPREKRRKELETQLFISQEETLTEESWTLPKNWEGTNLQWQRVVEDDSLLLWVGSLVVGVMVYLLSDRDLHQKIEKRREHMKREYPDIVHKLALYLGAGMTLQGAFQKIAAEYEDCKLQGQSKGPAYEELLYTCRELKSGLSESAVYERFGKRTGLQEYIRLSTLMTQNLKKGSSSLLARLQEEADRALTERIQSGKKLGEEASTKLLIPMVMMLAVVMVMVMLPAFTSMGL